MSMNSVYNIQTSTSFGTKNTFFSLEKQSSEINYQQLREDGFNNTDNHTINKIDDREQNNTTIFNGYYNMFIATQKLQNSEVLRNYNYQMYMKKYA